MPGLPMSLWNNGDNKAMLFILLFLLVSSLMALQAEYSGHHSLIIYVTFAPRHGHLPKYLSYGMLDDYRVFSYESTSDLFSHPFGQLESLSTVWRDLRDCTNFKTVYFNLFSRNANLTLGLKDASSSLTDENKLHIGLITGLVTVFALLIVLMCLTLKHVIWGKISVT